MSQTLISHIVKTPGVCSGQPRIDNTRISVAQIVIQHEHFGLPVDVIASEHDLTLGQVYAALAYYHNNRQEIDAWIHDSDAVVEALREKTPSKLPRKV